MLARYVLPFELSGSDEMSWFHGLSAGKIWQPPIVPTWALPPVAPAPAVPPLPVVPPALVVPPVPGVPPVALVPPVLVVRPPDPTPGPLPPVPRWRRSSVPPQPPESQ